MSNAQSVQSGNKNPSQAFERRVSFDQFQRDHPDVLVPDLDPDPPVPLASGLGKFDRPIMNRLTKVLPADQSRALPGDPLPLPSAGIPKATCLAEKLASGHSDLTKDHIDNLAARIGWLLRNWFRRDARDGYEMCLRGKRPRPKKSAVSKAKTLTTMPQAGGKTTSPPQRATPQSPVPPPPFQTTNPSLPAPSSGERQQQFQGADEGINPAHPELFGAQEQRVPMSPNLVEIAPADEDDLTFGVRPMDGPDLSIQPNSMAADRVEWQREIKEVRAAGFPLDPPRLKTFAMEFPVPKAKAFFLAVYRAKGSSEQAIVLGKDLAADHDALSDTIAVNKSAKDDVINWFAFLGIDLC